ncbi:YvcT [Thermobacillus xylanilyticus]|uniref:YvcT n=1 Tax=Thermobacillus xylanilyticus TaxID=76633 RepID=A0ABM8V485_THEXY|nr:D-glycerate dehydrogenase [Thermobacillus xylanilyticus]REJ12904.1 MAG: bifunctional glyoxylate/hydroxypyruvate reductase B [Paenibacillaceae bacterium]CAG5086359.1 YvcT [Thermobacillus xylanilyticus]
MKRKVYAACELPAEAKAHLEEHFDCGYWTGPGPIAADQLREAAAEAEGIIVTGTPVDAGLLEALPRLRAVSNLSVGYNNLDLEAMRRRGIIGMHTPHVTDDSVADLTFALMLAAARRVTEMDRFVRSGKWMPGPDRDRFGLDVHHAMLGIIGMGRIGEAVARRARFGFEMDVLYCNRSRKVEAERKLGVVYSPLEELLQSSDFVVMLAPLTRETRRMMGERQFSLMKKTAVFVNVSRGETVDEAALVRALRSGTIRAAGLDVYEKEPIAPDHPLLALDNVVALPHLGSATARTRHAMAMMAVRNLTDALVHGNPRHVIPDLMP